MIGAMRRHSVVSFFVIAYAISWAVWIPMALAGARVVQGSGWPTHIPGLFGPIVAAFVMWAVVGGRRGRGASMDEAAKARPGRETCLRRLIDGQVGEEPPG